VATPPAIWLPNGGLITYVTHLKGNCVPRDASVPSLQTLTLPHSTVGSHKTRGFLLMHTRLRSYVFAAVAVISVLSCPFAYGQTSTWCHFNSGTLMGQTINYAPLPPLPIGYPCHAGFSFGSVVPPPVVNPLVMLDAQLRALPFSGVVYISKNGTVRFDKAYGQANIVNGVPNDSRGVFAIGSLTKQFTAAAILKLQEQGRLSIGDHICQYIAPCSPMWGYITIRELLNHSSGIPDYVGLPQIRMAGSMSVTPAQIIASVETLPLQFSPGSMFQYSNSGYAILGAIIEKVSGMSYGAFMQQEFFGPLNLNNTSYSPGTPISTVGYGPNLTVMTPNRFIAYSAGGITSTADDLGSWVEGLAFGNTLSPSSQQAMFSPSIAAPLCSASYGLGWCIGSLSNGNTVYFHDGDIAGFDSAISVVPNRHLIVVMLSNVQDSNIMNQAEQIANALSN
jgi:CubicO group peptidase (beta-lactamase class C family)